MQVVASKADLRKRCVTYPGASLKTDFELHETQESLRLA